MDAAKTKLLLTRREAGEALGVSIDTIARLIQCGELRHVRIGRSVLVPRGELSSLVERREASTTDSGQAGRRSRLPKAMRSEGR